MSRTLLAGLLLGLCACSTPRSAPDISELYTRIAREGGGDRDPVVVLPGILGSNLADSSGRAVWGAWSGDYARPSDPAGLRALAIPMTPGLSLRERSDDVRAAGAVESVEIRLLGFPIELAAYVHILRTLGVGGYLDADVARAGFDGADLDYGEEHFTCFQFAYDWRRDIVESAQALDRFLRDEVLPAARREGREGPLQVDVVAHSMGGLVLRWYLRYGAQDLPEDGSLPEPTWAGAELIDQAVLVGTPNLGSVGALERLLEGAGLGPLFADYPAAQVATFPSLYQLLPRADSGRVVDSQGDPMTDLLEVSTWAQNGWGLLDPSQSDVLEDLLPEIPTEAHRRAVAEEHLARCLARAKQVQAALDRPLERPANLELMLFAGDAEPTPDVVQATSTGHKLRSRAPGDGRVTRASALGDQRSAADWGPRLVTPIPWSRVQFVFSNHLGLTEHPSFVDNLLYALLESPR